MGKRNLKPRRELPYAAQKNHEIENGLRSLSEAKK
jgi:hypothetical protein